MSYYDPNQQHQQYQQQGYGGQQQSHPQQAGYGGQQHQQGGYQQPPQYGHSSPPPHHTQQAPPQQQGYSQPPVQSHGPPTSADTGTFQGVSWEIKHRNTNSILNLTLSQNESVKTKPGAMIHMSPTVTLQGSVKVSMKKLFTGGQMVETTVTGPGTIALAPTLFGDIITLDINPNQLWNVGKDAYLACTSGVSKDTKSQGLGKALFSGEDLFVYKMLGQGVAWLTSYGAIVTKHLQAGEQHIVDNGHLVAWSCEYKIEKAGGGAMQGMKTGEGLVCRFTGPGTVLIQTRNLGDFAEWVRSVVPSS